MFLCLLICCHPFSSLLFSILFFFFSTSLSSISSYSSLSFLYNNFFLYSFSFPSTSSVLPHLSFIYFFPMFSLSLFHYYLQSHLFFIHFTSPPPPPPPPPPPRIVSLLFLYNLLFSSHPSHSPPFLCSCLFILLSSTLSRHFYCQYSSISIFI